LIEIEHHIELFSSSLGEYEPSQDSRELFILLSSHKKEILDTNEATWRQNSRAIWLDYGDENTKIFHSYVKGRNIANTIWSL